VSGHNWDFFVSYTQTDRAWAEWISWALEEVSFRVLVKAWDFMPGSNWVEQMRRGVELADRTVVVLSGNYPGSRYGAAEWRQAWLHDPTGEFRKVLVVRVEDCQPPDLLEQVVYIDLFGLESDQARERLLISVDAAVNNLRMKPSQEPPFPATLPGYPAIPGAQAETRSLVSRRRLPTEILPALPARYVPRDDDVAAVQQLLTDLGGEPTVGIVGMGGVGKSTLARAVVRTEEVKASFPDGILWIDAGVEVDLTMLVATVLTAFGDAVPVVDLTNGIARARRLLAGTACLIVVDNVWSAEVLGALPVSLPTRLLVTTRRRDTLFASSAVHLLAGVDNAAGRRLLARYACCRLDELPDLTDEILERCGGLVLALTLVGGMASEGLPWGSLLERLRRPALDRLTGRIPDYPFTSLLAALDISISTLDDNARDRFLELAIFDGTVPVPVVTRLWQVTAGMDDLDADDLIRLFIRRSLVQIDLITDQVTVHDLLLDYAWSVLPATSRTNIHLLFTDDLLSEWGGLGAGLPRLRDMAQLNEADRYGITQFVAHLLAADRSEVVDELLTSEWVAATGRAHSMWYTVHENLDQTSAYLADVRIAWQDAIDHQTPNSPGRQILCALIIGSINSIAANIPPALLIRAVTLEAWPLQRALAYAQSIPIATSRIQALAGLAALLDPEEGRTVLDQALDEASHFDEPDDRAEALTELAPHFDHGKRYTVVGQALDAATHMDWSYAQKRTLIALAAYLDQEQLNHALDIATTIEKPADLAEVLAGLAPHLAPEQRRTVLDQALDATVRIDQSKARAEILSELITYLEPAQLSRALDIATHIDESDAVTWMLCRLAAHLNAEQLNNTLDMATRIDEPGARAQALAELAAHLDAEQLNRAIDAATRIDSPDARVEALIGLAPHLAPQAAAPILDQILDAATNVLEPMGRLWILDNAAAHLGIEQLNRVLDEATRIDEPHAHAQTLAKLAVHLDSQQRRIVLDQALDIAARLDEPEYRAQVLTEVAAYLDPDHRRIALDQALDAATHIDQANTRARALTKLAVHLDPEPRRIVLDQALDAISHIDQPYALAATLAELAALLDPAQLNRALEAATYIDWADGLVGTLAELASYHDPEPRRIVLDQALDAATHIDQANTRARALTKLAVHLDPEPRRIVLDQVLDIAARLDGPMDRAQVLTEVAAYLDPEHRHIVLDQALDAITHIHQPDSLAWMLTELAALLDSVQLSRALDVASRLDEPEDRPELRARVLTDLATYLAPEQRRIVLGQALDAATYIDEPHTRARILTTLAGRLDPDLRSVVVGEALAAAALAGRFAVVEVIDAVTTDEAGWSPPDQTARLLLDVHRWWP